MYKFAVYLMRLTGRGKNGMKRFSPAGRKVLAAIAQQDYHKMKCSCTMEYVGPLEALLLTCVKWAFNVPDEESIIPGDIPRWSLGRGANTSPLCMLFITDCDVIDCEKCPIDMASDTCWLPSSSYMKTIMLGKKKYYLKSLIREYKTSARRQRYRGRPFKQLRRRRNEPLTGNLFLSGGTE